MLIHINVVSSLYLWLWEIGSASLLVFLTSSNSCDFGLPMGAGEFKVFLLHHLCHFPFKILFQIFGEKPISEPW